MALWQDVASTSQNGREHNNLVVKRFANGDEYHGRWHNGFPDGDGVYKWADGSSYHGTWSQGLKDGVGKYVWPNRATYTGEWKQGCMHGMGTFQAPDGTYYQGGWAWDLKHGLGKKVYSNGDIYEGLWKKGKAEGPGRYRWSDGNEYDGEWKSGKMHGNGTFVWKSGERYDGEWSAGQESGIGVFTWTDGSVYDGFWEAGLKHGIGIFWRKWHRGESPGCAASRHWRSDLDCVPAFSSHSYTPEKADQEVGFQGQAPKRTATEPVGTSAGGVNGDVAAVAPKGVGDPVDQPIQPPAVTKESPTRLQRRMSVGGAENLMVLREYVQGRLTREAHVTSSVLETVLHVSNRTIRKMEKKGVLQRPGEIIFKGHQSYDLMLNLQQGIRYSIGRITPMKMPKVLSADSAFQKVKVEFPRAGSTTTPPHTTSDFVWKDYAPLTFRRLRELFQIDASDYMLSLCGNQALRELKTPGKSGSVFYLSHDSRFMVKTMRKEEMQVLLAMLPKYYEHICSHPHTLLTKFYGLHRIKTKKKRNVRFVVMGNIMMSDVVIHKLFDLKGSTAGRFTDGPVKPTTVFKDLDLDCTFKLEEGWRERFVRQMKRDCDFLESSYVMDYSLLLGIHYRNRTELNGVSETADEAAVELSNIRESISVRNFRNVADGTDSTKGEQARELDDGSPSVPGMQHTLVTETTGIEPQWVESLLKLAQRRLREDTQDSTAKKTSAVLATAPKRSMSMRPVAYSDGASDAIAAALHQPCVRLGTNMAAVMVPSDGSEPQDVVLLFGIIDVLQEYDNRKRFEHAYKSIREDGNSISAVNPKRYSQRFQDFMKMAFV